MAPRRSRSFRPATLGAVALAAMALSINTRIVDATTRAAAPRDGGSLVATDVARANVKVEGSGPPIVLIHGFGAAIDWWDAIAPTLAASHRVIRLDLIGHGGTEAPVTGYAIERQAELVAAVLDALGVGRVTVVGHSMGGEVATAFAVRDPRRIDCMILIDSPPTAGTHFTLLTRAYLAPVLGELLSRLRTGGAVRRGLEQGFAPGFAFPEAFVADLEQLPYPAFRGAHDESVAYRNATATSERLAALDPTPRLLVLFGALDAIVPPSHAQLFARVPGAQIAMLAGVGHSPMVEAPDATLAHIQSFLAAP